MEKVFEDFGPTAMEPETGPHTNGMPPSTPVAGGRHHVPLEPVGQMPQRSSEGMEPMATTPQIDPHTDGIPPRMPVATGRHHVLSGPVNQMPPHDSEAVLMELGLDALSADDIAMLFSDDRPLSSPQLEASPGPQASHQAVDTVVGGSNVATDGPGVVTRSPNTIAGGLDLTVGAVDKRIAVEVPVALETTVFDNTNKVCKLMWQPMWVTSDSW